MPRRFQPVMYLSPSSSLYVWSQPHEEVKAFSENPHPQVRLDFDSDDTLIGVEVFPSQPKSQVSQHPTARRTYPPG